MSAPPLRCPFLTGREVYLRPLELADAEGPYLEWINEYEVTRFMETGVFPTTAEGLRRYVESVTASPATVMLAIVERETGLHIGNIKLGPIRWIHRRADMGIMLGDRTRWGRGYGREAVALILGYAFEWLNLNKVTLGVDTDNVAAVRIYESLGFKIEGTQRRHLFRDGAYRDNHVMGFLQEDYRRMSSTP